MRFKVDKLQIILVAKKHISTCRNCSSVGCLKCVCNSTIGFGSIKSYTNCRTFQEEPQIVKEMKHRVLGKYINGCCKIHLHLVLYSCKFITKITKQPVHRRCFIFLFVLFENSGESTSEASARETKINVHFLLPPPIPPCADGQ